MFDVNTKWVLSDKLIIVLGSFVQHMDVYQNKHDIIKVKL